MRDFNEEIKQELELIGAGDLIDKWSRVVNSDNYCMMAYIVNIFQLFLIICKQLDQQSDVKFIYFWIQL